MKRIKKLWHSILMIAAITAALVNTTACSNEKDEPSPPVVESYFFKQCELTPKAHYYAVGKLMYIGQNLMMADFLNDHPRLVSCAIRLDHVPYEYYDPIDKKKALEALRAKYNDGHFTGNTDPFMYEYNPLVCGISSIKLSCEKWDDADGDLNDHFFIEYITYREFVENGFKWPQGSTGPVKKKHSINSLLTVVTR